ncbi:hypothetical protein D3C74_457840 [compost metagenome]
MACTELCFLKHIFRVLAYISLHFLCAMTYNYNSTLASGRFYCIKYMPDHRFAADGVQHFV